MGNGYNPGRLDDENRFRAAMGDILRRLASLETPTGTSVNSLVAQVQAAIANINTTVNNAIATNSYTKAQIDNKVANPPAGSAVTGNVSATGNVSGSNGVFSGQVQSNGSPFLSVPSHNYTVHVGSWVACWIDSDGSFGTSPSTSQSKMDLAAFTDNDATKFLNAVTPYWGRYVWDAPDAPMKAFVLAEDVANAGLGPDVAPLVEGTDQIDVGIPGHPVMVQPGQPWTVNYSQLVVPLLAVAREQQAKIAALEADMVAVKAKLGL